MTTTIVKPNPVVSAQEVQARLWLRGLTAVMMKASRILLDNGTMMVKEVDPGATGYYRDTVMMTAPGWTDGKDVFVNQTVLVPSIMAGMAANQHDTLIASIKGLIFHENAHILYTPRWSQVEGMAGNNRATMYAFNMLEDQRIERLLVARWPHVKPYFIHLIAQWVLAGNAPSGTAHALLYGRDYLGGGGIRKASREAFIKEMGVTATDEVELIISTFVKLTFPRNLAQGVRLAERLAAILWTKPGALRKHAQDVAQGKDGVGDHPATDKGRDVGMPDEKGQDTDGANAGEVASTDDGEMDGDGDGTDGEGAGTPADGNGSGEGDGEGNGGEGDTDSGGESAGAAQDDKSGGKGVAGEGGGDSITEAAERMRNDLESDTAFREDVRATMGDVRKQIVSGGFQPHLPSEVSNPQSYRPAVGNPAVASQHTQRVIRELQDFVAPGWDRQMESGRLNPDAYLRRQPGSTDFFDQWNPGREHEASCEIVVLLDTSGSMDPMTEASQAMWVIKASADRLNIPCTVIGFNDKGRYIYKRGESTQRAKYRNLRGTGGTTPHDSLDEAILLLSTSKAKTRLLFAITDGEWTSPNTATDRFDLLNAIGVITSYIGIGTIGLRYGRLNDWYHSHTHAVISTPMEVVQIVRTTVKAAIARRLMG